MPYHHFARTQKRLQVQGLICIIVDKQEVLVVPVRDHHGQAALEPCVACGHAAKQSRKERKRSFDSEDK
jgi:Zn ribbon nucleic-acid-binding protein